MFDVRGGKLYVLNGNILTVYDESLEKLKSYDLDDDYSDIKVIGKHAYLLGYNQVQRWEL